MDTKTILSEASDRMQKTIEHLEEELLNIRAGKASPTVLNGVFVDYYGSQTPISGVASVTVPDAKTILIQPWDKNLIRAIEKAIIDSNIGLTPSNNGGADPTVDPAPDGRAAQRAGQAGTPGGGNRPHQLAQRTPGRCRSLQEGPEGRHVRRRGERR